MNDEAVISIVDDYIDTTATIRLPRSISPDVQFLFSHDIDLINENQSTTTRHTRT